MNRLVLGSTLVCSLALLGCGDDTGTETDMGTTGEDSDSTTSEGPSESETEGSSGDSEPVLPDNEPARGGITITWVEANQGIGVKIGDNGAGVPGADRTAYLPQGRTTLIRAFWEIPEDWKPRKIRGRLSVQYADGEVLEQEQTVMIDGEAFVGDLKRSFYWGLMADQVEPGLKYKVELLEVEAGFEEIPENDVPPSSPHEGWAQVGIEDSYQVMRVIVVPFNIPNGTSEQPDCVTSLETISDALKKQFSDYIFMMNPIDTLEIEWHDAIDWSGTLQSFGQTNSYMAQLRFEEVPDNPEVYYYGVADVCAGGLAGAGGLANGIPTQPIKSAAAARVSSGVLLTSAALGENPDWMAINADTFVHEVGHSQGRRHVTCSGDEGGPDPAYPVDGGDIGEFGWGVIDFGLKHATVYKDYMTYCNPAWVSTYGWNKVYPTIKELSSWDFEDTSGGDQGDLYARYGGTLLMGHINPNGTAEWSTLPGALADAPPSAAHHVELVNGDGAVELAVTIEDQDDGGTLIWAQLPADIDRETLNGASEIVWVDDVTNARRSYAASTLNELRARVRADLKAVAN